MKVIRHFYIAEQFHIYTFEILKPLVKRIVRICLVYQVLPSVARERYEVRAIGCYLFSMGRHSSKVRKLGFIQQPDT